MDVASAKQQAQELERQGKVREALAMYRHVLTSLEGTPELLQELPLYVKAGDLYLKLDNPRAAVSLYETAGKIYAAHGSARSVNAICAKVVRVMPERTHVYTRLLRIMLEHGHVAAARHVLTAYAEHAELSETRERLDLLADRTDEHVRPVLEMLVEMAERLERPGAATAEPPRPEEIGVAVEAMPPEPTAPPPPIDGRLGYGVPDEEAEEVSDETGDAEPAANGLGLGLLMADAVPVAEASDGEGEDEPEEERDAEEVTTPAAEHVLDADGSRDDVETADAVTENETVGGPFGLGLVTSDLASDVLPPPGDDSAASIIRSPFEESPPPGAEESEPPPDPLVHSTVEPAEPERHLDAPVVLPGDVPQAEPEIASAPGPATRQRVRGDGTDWVMDPGLPGRAARRRSPVGSVLLAVAEREERRRPRYVLLSVVALLVVVVLTVMWIVRSARGSSDAGEPGAIADSALRDSAMGLSAAAGPPQAGEQAGQAPLTLRPDPALAVESLALPPLDESLSPGGATRPRVGMPASEGGVTVVAIAGLPIEHVSEVTIDGRQGQEAQQVLPTGERLWILSLPAAEPADTAVQGEVRIAPGAEGMLTARLRVGTHDVELRGNVSEAGMRDLVLRLAETSTSPS